MEPELFSAKWVIAWLDGRDKENLYAFSNPINLTLGLIDSSTSDYIRFKIQECKEEPKLHKLYTKALKNNKYIQGQMLKDWLHAIS